jgi:SAM-dependent methyltransferase
MLSFFKEKPIQENKEAKQKDITGSPHRFGYQWNTYSKIVPAYEEQFKRWTTLISQEEWRGKSFLDVGCGMGRNSYWPIQYGAKRGVGIDIDKRSLAATQENLKMFPQFEARELSAYDIDYQGEFDIAFSIGVIHHLQDPQHALQNMTRAVKPGGKILIWVYGQENVSWVNTFFNPFRKGIFSKLPISLTHFLSLFPTALLWGFLKLNFGKIEYFELLRNFSFWHLRLIVFDQMLPEIANYWSYNDVLNLMQISGLESIQIKSVNDMSWCAVGVKATKPFQI